MTSRLIACSVLAALAVFTPRSPVAGQERAQRMHLEHFRDTLAFSHDLAWLRALEVREIAVARSRRDDAMVHLRLGLIAMRLHAVDSISHADDAISEFEWAASLEPEWPWPWLGLGLAESLVRDRSRSFAGGLWFMLGLDRETRAGAAFARAISVDPSFVDGLAAYARTALAQRIDAPVGPALDALRAAMATPVGWHPDLLLERGRLERRAQAPDSAVRMFSLALLLGRHNDLAMIELARTLPLVATSVDQTAMRSRYETAYYAAAASRHPEVVAMYRRDIEPIAADSQLLRFDALRGSDRVSWLRTFWSERDAIDLRDSGDRLGEHFRRWAVAQREFRLPPFRRHYAYGAERYRSGDRELDDRGIIWLRHGEPAVRIEWPRGRSTAPSAGQRHYGNESWRYDRPDGALVLHFVAKDDPQDYRVVETPALLDVPGDVVALRAHELPGVARLLRVNEESASWNWVSEDVRLRGRRSVAVATLTDSWERQYPVTLEGRAQWLAVGVRDERPLLHLVYAVDAAALRAVPGADTLRQVPVAVRAVAFDRNGATLGTLDTVQSVPMPSPDTRLVAMRAEFLAAPGTVRVRLGVELTPRVGAVYPVDSLVVPAIHGDSIALSALLVGVHARSLPWAATPADTAWLDAGGRYTPSDTLVIYTEAYGLRAGSVASVRLSVTRRRTGMARVLGGAETAIALTERVTPEERTIAIRRTIGLGELQPGSYILEMRVEQGGRSIVRRRGLTIVSGVGAVP